MAMENYFKEKLKYVIAFCHKYSSYRVYRNEFLFWIKEDDIIKDTDNYFSFESAGLLK